MGRKPDQHVKKLKQRALKLEAEGRTAVEISENVGRTPDTVRGWLRELRGSKWISKDRVLELADQGSEFGAIAIEMGVTEGQIRRIVREETGLAQPHASAGELVDQFLALKKPEMHFHKRYLRYESVQKELLARAARAVNKSAASAAPLVDLAVDLLATLLSLRKKPEIKRKTACWYVQALAISSAMLRKTGSRNLSRRRLGQARRLGKGCEFCAADLGRRDAILLRDAGDIDRAYEKILQAKAIYTKHDTPGHDLWSNGLGSCALVESGLAYYKGEFRRAAREAEEIVRKGIIKPSEFDLYPHILIVVVASNLKLGGGSGARTRQSVVSGMLRYLWRRIQRRSRADLLVSSPT